jgi:hypothetical protein
VRFVSLKLNPLPEKPKVLISRKLKTQLSMPSIKNVSATDKELSEESDDSLYNFTIPSFDTKQPNQNNV